MEPVLLSNIFLSVFCLLFFGLPLLSYHSIYTIVYWGLAVGGLGKDGWRLLFLGDQNQKVRGVIDKDAWAFWQAGFFIWFWDDYTWWEGGGWAGLCAGVSLLFCLV